MIAGLAILVFELGQTRDLLRSQTRNELSSSIVDHLLVIADSPQFLSVMRRGEEGEELTPDEWFQFEVRSRALLRYWENVHYQYRNGFYDEVEFASHRDGMGAHLEKAAAVVRAWCGMRAEFSPKFRAEIDGLLTTFQC